MRAALSLSRRLARPSVLSTGRRLRSTAAAPASLAASWDRPFPSLLISEDRVSAQGSFAEAQANYLQPDMQVVKELDALLHEKKMGIVAHFYMDPELQGILSSLKWEHTFIADSLAMGEAAAKMAKKGIQSVAVLGVDFMSESVRANLDSNNFEHIPVYRLAEQKIGCSLAESAERQAYIAYLQKASKTPNSLHIVYINTSLRSKAYAHDLVPTITCTSSNVVQTVLQAFAQVPDITIWYGPDTYMGENLEQMFQQIGQLPDEKIRQIHPQHNQKTIAQLLTRFEYFKEGNCVVHHMFGDKVTNRVREEYSDAFHTAHFEVPGEMFTLAMEAQNEGRGVVGSTSNILNFIKDKTREAVKKESTEKLSFVLGTEVGMVTAIVRGVQDTLRSQPGSKKPEIEIIFPVSADAVATEGEELVPGVAGGEGCSTAGGCATCPFMKMNDIDALFNVVEGVSADARAVDPLANFYPQKYSELIAGKTISDIGVQPILHMKAFMEGGKLSDALVKDIQTRTPGDEGLFLTDHLPQLPLRSRREVIPNDHASGDQFAQFTRAISTQLAQSTHSQDGGRKGVGREQGNRGADRTAGFMGSDAASFKPTIVKKSTMEVLNDTDAALSPRSRNIDEHLAKTALIRFDTKQRWPRRAQVHLRPIPQIARMSVQEKSPLLKPEPSKVRGKEPDVDIRAEFLSLTSMALQVSLSTFARLALTSVDYAFLGHLGTKELAAASLSSVWTSVPLMGVWAGAGALTTLCGQAWGAKNFELTGVWLQMGIVVCSIFVIPVFIWYWCVEYALVLSTDDPEVIHLGGRFARIISFASWPAVAYACVRLYFQSMGIMAPTTVVGGLSIGVAITANYFLIYGCLGWGGLGFDGSPLATVIASWFQPIALVSYCVFYKKMHLRAWGGWDLTAFTPDRLKTYANIAGFIAANSMISNLASSSLSLIAAKLGSDIIAANAVITGLWRLLWALFWGFGCATQIRVANCLGANRPHAAKALAKLGFGCTIACVAVLATITLSLREKLFQLYTTDDDLLRLCMLVQPIFITGYMIESIEMLTSGVLTAMGQVRVIAWTSTFSTWCIELPMAYIGGIVLGFGFPALWYSICTMEVVKLTVYLIALSRTDWSEMARTAVENMEVTDETTGELEDEAFSFALSEGGNAPLGYNTVPLSPLTPIPTPSSISSKQWGDDIEDGNGLHIRRSRRTGSTGGL